MPFDENGNYTFAIDVTADLPNNYVETDQRFDQRGGFGVGGRYNLGGGGASYSDRDLIRGPAGYRNEELNDIRIQQPYAVNPGINTPPGEYSFVGPDMAIEDSTSAGGAGGGGGAGGLLGLGIRGLAALLARNNGTDASGNSTSITTREFTQPYGDMTGAYQDLLRQLMSGIGGNIHVPGGSIHASQATARHAKATHAEASLIDMLDKAYNERPDADLREDIYGRLSTGARASAANEARSIKDAARLSGAGPNAPWAQSLIAEANRNASKTATQGLTDFYDRYVEAAFARRHGALSTNAELQTGVNTFNAGADNQVSMFNAGADNQVSMFNAGARNQAAGMNAQLNQSAAQLREAIRSGRTNDIISLLRLNQPIETTTRTEGTQTQHQDPNRGQELAAYAALIERYMDSRRK